MSIPLYSFDFALIDFIGRRHALRLERDGMAKVVRHKKGTINRVVLHRRACDGFTLPLAHGGHDVSASTPLGRRSVAETKGLALFERGLGCQFASECFQQYDVWEARRVNVSLNARPVRIKKLAKSMGKIVTKDLVFALNKPIGFEESMTCEFKEVKNDSPLQAIGKKVDEYVVAFLNAMPGSIFWGIRNDRTVVGVHMNDKMRDELKQVVGQKIGAIAPPVSAECYELPFHQVFQSGETGKLPVDNTFVVEVRVLSAGGRLYLTGSGECYRKTLGGVKKLTGSELFIALEKELEAKRKTPSGGELGLASMPSVERRASVVTPLLQGARVLWVDDHPINNLYERTFLASLDISVDLAVSTEEAVYMATHLRYDLILSDMERGTCPTAGIELLSELTSKGSRTPLVFYVGHAEKGRLPTGAFAITHSPDELMHYIFDVLERRPSSLPKAQASGA